MLGARPPFHPAFGRARSRLVSTEQTAFAGYFFRTRRDAPDDPLVRPESPSARTPRLARLEAALFVADRPQTARRLAQHATLADATDAIAAITELNVAYDRCQSAFRIERVATGYQLLTRPQYAAWLDRVHQRHTRLRLSPPALETLAIVAYRQPLTRADVEAVRGTQSGEMLKQLMERGLVRIEGEEQTLGRPFLYGTTRKFLELFGLHNVADLPGGATLRRGEPTATATLDEDDADAAGDEPTPDLDSAAA